MICSTPGQKCHHNIIHNCIWIVHASSTACLLHRRHICSHATHPQCSSNTPTMPIHTCSHPTCFSNCGAELPTVNRAAPSSSNSSSRTPWLSWCPCWAASSNLQQQQTSYYYLPLLVKQLHAWALVFIASHYLSALALLQACLLPWPWQQQPCQQQL